MESSRIQFNIGDFHYEPTNEMELANIIYDLSNHVNFKLMNSNGNIKLQAVLMDNLDKKLEVIFEKSPWIVEDGKQTMRDYIQQKVRDLAVAMFRQKENLSQ